MSRWRLGVAGPIGVGKDTVCAAVAERLGAGRAARRIRIGDLVVDDLDHVLSGVEDPPVTARDAARLRVLRATLPPARESRPSIRQLPDRVLAREVLQWWGAVRRDQQPGYWLERLHVTVGSAVRPAAGAPVLVYVTDVRRDPEIELLRRMSFVVVELTAPHETCAGRVLARDGRALSTRASAGDEWRPAPGGHPLVDLVVPNVADPGVAAAEIVSMLMSRELVRNGGRA